MIVADHYVLPTSLYIFFKHGGPPGQPQVACHDFTQVSLIFITKLQIGSQESILLFISPTVSGPRMGSLTSY